MNHKVSQSRIESVLTLRKSCSEERPIALHLLGGDQKADSNLGDRLTEMTEALMKAAEAGEAKVASLLHRAIAMVALLAAKVNIVLTHF